MLLPLTLNLNISTFRFGVSLGRAGGMDLVEVASDLAERMDRAGGVKVIYSDGAKE